MSRLAIAAAAILTTLGLATAHGSTLPATDVVQEVQEQAQPPSMTFQTDEPAPTVIVGPSTPAPASPPPAIIMPHISAAPPINTEALPAAPIATQQVELQQPDSGAIQQAEATVAHDREWLRRDRHYAQATGDWGVLYNDYQVLHRDLRVVRALRRHSNGGSK
jgi:hypothetical protein